MSLVAKSLNSATAAGNGTAIFFDTPKTQISAQLVSTGSPSTILTSIKATLDGVTFVEVSGQTGDGIVDLPAHAVVGVRVDLTTLTGGTSPTITVTIAAHA